MFSMSVKKGKFKFGNMCVLYANDIQYSTNEFKCPAVSPVHPFPAAAEQMIMSSLLSCLMTTHQHRQRHLQTHQRVISNDVQPG